MAAIWCNRWVGRDRDRRGDPRWRHLASGVLAASLAIGISSTSGSQAAPAAPPANDNLAGAVTIGPLPFGLTQNTREATSESGETPTACAPYADRGVWFRYTSEGNQRIHLATAGSNYFTVLSVWHGADHPLQLLACADRGQRTQGPAADTSFQAVTGATYLIKIEAAGLAGDLVLYADVEQAPPANDSLAAAALVDTIPYSIGQDIAYATHEAGEAIASCASGTTRSVWYRFVAPTDGNVRLSVQAPDFNPILSIWRGLRHPLQELACRSGYSGNQSSNQISFPARAGATVYIKIEAATPDTTGYSVLLQVEPAADLVRNDALATAADIATLPYQATVDNSTAGDEPFELPAPCVSPAGHGLWFRYASTAAGRLRLTVQADSYDPVLSVWQGQQHPLEPIACQDDVSGNDPMSSLTLSVAAGQVYYIKLEGRGDIAGGVGSAVLTAFEPPPLPANDDLAQARPIRTLPFRDAPDAAEATREPDEVLSSCGYSRSGTLWYRFAATTSGRLVIGHPENSDVLQLSAWRGAGHPLQQLACRQITGLDELSLPVVAGGTYFIQLEVPSGTQPVLLADVEPPGPANDDLSAAAEVGQLPFTHRVDTAGASTEPNESTSYCAQSPGHGVWYRVPVADDTLLRFDTAGSDFATVLSVWRGRGHPLEYVACQAGSDSATTGPIEVPARAGDVVLVKVEGSRNQFGHLVFNAVALTTATPEPTAAPPANNGIASALPIARVPFWHTQDTRTATTEHGEARGFCATGADNGVWFRYTATVAGRLRLDTGGSDYATVLSAWRGDRHPLRELACQTDVDGRARMFTLTLTVAAGDSVLIKAESTYPGGGKLVLSAYPPTRPPVNDDLAGAAPIDQLPFQAMVDNGEASTEPLEASASCQPGDHGLWYRYVPAASGRMRLDTVGSPSAGLLSVWQGEGHPLQPVACGSNLMAGGPTGSLTLPVVAGQPLFIKLESYDGAGGDFLLNASLPPPSPPNDDLAEALIIDALPFQQPVDVAEAGREPRELPSRCGDSIAGGGVWYRFRPTADGRVRLDNAAGNSAAQVSVWRGDRHPLRELGCQANVGGFGWAPPLTVDLKAGQDYLIRYEGYGPLTPTVYAAPPLPANDNLAEAMTIATLPFAHEVETMDATWEPGEAVSACGGAHALSLWYRVTPAASGRIRFASTGSSYAPLLSAWVDHGPTLREIACTPLNGPHQSLTLPMDAGSTYYVRAESASGESGRLLLSASLADMPPANDNLAAATAINALPFRTILDITSATREPGEALSRCGQSSGRGLWYRYQPATTSWLRLDTQESARPVILSLWTGAGHPLTEDRCSSQTHEAPLDVRLTQGQTYLIRVEQVENQPPDGVILVASVPPPPPANDDLAGALAFNTLPFSHTVGTTTATTEVGELVNSCLPGGGHGVWYRYTPAADGALQIGTEGSDFPTLVSVWQGSNHPLTELLCGQAGLRWTFSAGQTYYFKVETSWGPGGQLQFHAHQPGPEPPGDGRPRVYLPRLLR